MAARRDGLEHRAEDRISQSSASAPMSWRLSACSRWSRRLPHTGHERVLRRSTTSRGVTGRPRGGSPDADRLSSSGGKSRWAANARRSVSSLPVPSASP
jgi:hypothetical protein